MTKAGILMEVGRAVNFIVEITKTLVFAFDSRYPTRVGGIGYVPASNLVGRAEFILLSAGEGFSIKKPWTWGKMRKGRFFKGLR